jgi:WASH complex subunit 7
MSAPNPKQSPDPNLLTRGRYLGLAPIRLFGTRLVSIKLKVLHYLETTFYNLTTVALHDWKTYGEMRNLAYEKYGLDLMESHLPMGSLDQVQCVLHYYYCYYAPYTN